MLWGKTHQITSGCGLLALALSSVQTGILVHVCLVGQLRYLNWIWVSSCTHGSNLALDLGCSHKECHELRTLNAPTRIIGSIVDLCGVHETARRTMAQEILRCASNAWKHTRSMGTNTSNALQHQMHALILNIMALILIISLKAMI